MVVSTGHHFSQFLPFLPTMPTREALRGMLCAKGTGLPGRGWSRKGLLLSSKWFLCVCVSKI